MPHAKFVHLRVHTAYSLSEGAIPVKKLVDLCKTAGMPAVAITDTNNLFGALEFSGAAMGYGVQPIVGCQLSITQDAPADEAAALVMKRDGRKPEPDPIVLLAQNQVGYGNLMALTSKAFLETPPGETPQVDFGFLGRHAEGLICLTGGAGGPVGRLVAAGQLPAAQALVQRYADLFPGRLYVEIQRHGTPLEKRTEAPMLDLAYKLDLPLVATNECFFADAGMYEAHDALLCIAQGTFVGVEDRRRVTPEHRFKSAAEMRELFKDLPEAVDNTLVIARRCAYAAPERKPILPRFAQGGLEGEAEALRQMSYDGLEKRFVELGITDEAQRKVYRDRLEFELSIIIKMQFPGYFLIVADFIQWTKSQGIPVGPGRGSGAGSLVAYALTITDLDPLRFSLLFERFLNPERVSMPDFDIDFCQDRREEVITYVQQKYGRDQVAQIITFGKLQARAALRDVGRVLQLPLGQVDRICKMVPNNPANPVTLKQAIAEEPRLQAERDQDESVARMMDIALKLEGLYRNASTHAAGVVIGDRPLVELVPLYQDPRSTMPATQFSMKYAEGAGLVKFDFLGLKTLTVLQRAVELIRRREEIDLATIPLDDKASYDLLARGETVGVFQLESTGMRDMLRQMKADQFEDIIALVALYRPGPMDNIPKYIACKHGREEPDYLHPWLEPVLKETYGVIIYQEQVMEIAKVLAGYSLGDADLLRRAMGKKIKSEMDAQKERFVTGAREKGVDPGRAAYIFELVEKFAGYGFNKSHAAAYALVAYQTAYLKANYPVEFLAASMTLDLGNTDKLNVFRQDLRRLDIPLLPPDVQESEVVFDVAMVEGKRSVRYALAAVKGVGPEAMAAIVEARKAGGRYKSLFDMACRVEPSKMNKRMLENLVKAGAFDSLEKNRARAFAAIEPMLRHGQAVAADRASNQNSLFGAPEAAPPPPMPDVDGWTPMDQLAKEFDAIGFYLSAHPLDSYATVLRRLGVNTFADMARSLGLSPQRHKIAGSVIDRRERISQKGSRYAFVQCSDATGVYEVMVFSELLNAHRDSLEAGNLLVFAVDAQLNGDQARMTVQSIERLDEVAAKAAAGVCIYLDDVKPIETIRTVLAGASRGRGLVKVNLRLPDLGDQVEFQMKEMFAITPQVRGALKATRGVVDVQEL
ncbi:MAG: DNA polymerase III subunit alpha [Alphaproteobacteria bacterium]|jgi:DNA polymerase-3 subunit alpha|nr:DNA polymerase III subunit alpha [Alphaproteobacteria bacterium]